MTVHDGRAKTENLNLPTQSTKKYNTPTGYYRKYGGINKLQH